MPAFYKSKFFLSNTSTLKSCTKSCLTYNIARPNKAMVQKQKHTKIKTEAKAYKDKQDKSLIISFKGQLYEFQD
jgi:hypothetical protein